MGQHEPCYGQFDMIYTFNSRWRAMETFESPVKVNLSHIRRPGALLKYIYVKTLSGDKTLGINIS